MKFKKGDTILMRCKIEKPLFGNNVAVVFDGSSVSTGICFEELEKAVPYPADIPLPNQEVWVRDKYELEWKKAIYLYYDENNTNFPHHVLLQEDRRAIYGYKCLVTEDPYKESGCSIHVNYFKCPPKMKNKKELCENIKQLEKELEEIKEEVEKFKG